MCADTLVTFDSGGTTWATVSLAVLAAAVVLARRPPAPRLSLAAAAAGLVLLTLAALRPVWQRPAARDVAVMVDLSPSTRSADYRDRTVLEHRIHELLRDVPYHLEFFSGDRVEVDPHASRLADVPTEKTVYIAPAAGAVLLFSDCRFALPSNGPPTYTVADPALEDPEDAAVTDLEIRGGEVAVSVRNSGSSRQLVLVGVATKAPTTCPTGSVVVSHPLSADATRVSAELAPGDPWPENDALAAPPPAPQQFERWWVGDSPPPTGWRALRPAELPTDPTAYLAPAVIVLSDVPADGPGEGQRQRLFEYVRDLGGGLVILGGEHAFAAGRYDGTLLDALSPLASTPPQPTTHWVLLADASGSMSAATAGVTRWTLVCAALTRLLPDLPGDDLVSIGDFAADLRWWAQLIPARRAASMPLPPADAGPHGPTNLQPAIEAVAGAADGKMPVQLLVLSDCDTHLTDADQLASRLKDKNIHLHLLAIGQGSALASLRQVCDRTGGSVVTQLDPNRWATAARELARAAMPDLLQRRRVSITYLDEAADAGSAFVDLWNRVWLKESATEVAEGRSADQTLPMAARWNLGEGRVVAEAFAPTAGQVESLAELVARPPHDPRYHVNWGTGAQLRVIVTATDGRKYLNDQQVTIDLADSASPDSATVSRRIPQVGPGRYVLKLPAPRTSGVATVRVGGRVIDRIALAGRYAPEFDAIGNDHNAMRELARRTGGELVPPNRTAPLRIHWPPRPLPLSSPLAFAAACCFGLGLLWWKGKGSVQ